MEEAERLQVLVGSDEPWQRTLRVRQARWREARGFPIGSHNGRPLGSRLEMPGAREHLWNYLSDPIRARVRREVGVGRAEGKLFGEPRIWDDLLSSQPLCFNLFGELAADLDLASRTWKALGHDVRVTRVEFEWSPGRGDPRYTDDRSAFDVYVEGIGEHGACFWGIEVKYHESLKDRPGAHRPRYDQVADAMAVFRPEARGALRARPLQQVWRDHLLSGAWRAAGGFARGRFVLLYPGENRRCREAEVAYRAALLPTCDSFESWTLEHFVTAARTAGAGPWLDTLEDRYLTTTAP